MARTLIYSGSFDPVTNGHVDIFRQALDLADRLVVAIGIHPGKKPLFDTEERSAMIRETFAVLGIDDARVEVVAFSGLIVEEARRVGAVGIVRGLRHGSDLDYEMPMAGMNATMAPEIRTLFLPAAPGVGHITATLVRQIAEMGGDISAFVPEHVAIRLKRRFAEPRR